ncbi:MAG TPA: hypothetical protein PLR99_33415, partial [Polyangiaceae bacterium]|nr:hypothetical protein [Polyangiaceae bacterium]
MRAPWPQSHPPSTRHAVVRDGRQFGPRPLGSATGSAVVTWGTGSGGELPPRVVADDAPEGAVQVPGDLEERRVELAG